MGTEYYKEGGHAGWSAASFPQVIDHEVSVKDIQKCGVSVMQQILPTPKNMKDL